MYLGPAFGHFFGGPRNLVVTALGSFAKKRLSDSTHLQNGDALAKQQILTKNHAVPPSGEATIPLGVANFSLPRVQQTCNSGEAGTLKDPLKNIIIIIIRRC